MFVFCSRAVLDSKSTCHTDLPFTPIADSPGVIIAVHCYMASFAKDCSVKVCSNNQWISPNVFWWVELICNIFFRSILNFHTLHSLLVCYVNVHKRCQKNVANNCGINARQLADILNDMGMTPHSLQSRSKPPSQQGRAATKVRSAHHWLSMLYLALMYPMFYPNWQYIIIMMSLIATRRIHSHTRSPWCWTPRVTWWNKWQRFGREGTYNCSEATFCPTQPCIQTMCNYV